MPLTNNKLVALEAHLAELHHKVMEEWEVRLVAVKAEAEKKVAEVVTAKSTVEKAAFAKKMTGHKNKCPAESDKEDEDKDEIEKMLAPTQYMRAAKACIGAAGLPAKLQKCIEHKSDQSSQWKKAKCAPFVVPDDNGTDGDAGYMEGIPSSDAEGKGKAAEKGKGKGKVPVGILPSGAGPQVAGPVPVLDRSNPRYIFWFVILMVDKEAHCIELWQKEWKCIGLSCARVSLFLQQKVLKAAMAEAVHTEMQCRTVRSWSTLTQAEMAEQRAESEKGRTSTW
ncbi:hypothetical protein GY45DRAFT_1341573 [Cubamyces sp. BRFM 1775]|nr:hypothetical protein GY45DRAFT_1341573 [Cubamyces sp. BRFM 1775]